jgi:membrane protease YdiL (CAAX protease family)
MTIGKEFALLFAVLFLPGMLAQRGPVDPQAFENLTYHVQLLAVSVPQILLVVAFCDLRRPGSSARFGWRAPRRADLVAAGAALLAAWVVAGLVSLLISTIAGDAGARQPVVNWSFERYELIPLVLVSTFAIGYREEIFYRAYITDRAEEAQIDARVALGAGSLLFASGHVYQGVAGFVLALAIGAALSAVYYRTRSLHGIAAAHGIYNFIVLVASGAS